MSPAPEAPLPGRVEPEGRGEAQVEDAADLLSS